MSSQTLGRHGRTGRSTRSRLGTVLLVVAATLPVAGLLVAAPAAEAAKGTPRVAFCHATMSEKNPYRLITTDAASIIRSGHDHHAGPVYHPAASHWGDIVPAFSYRDKAGNLKHFSGSNTGSLWIVANGCSVTPHSVTVTAPVTTDETCTADGTITIAAVTGVDWKLDGTVTTAGTHTAAPGQHTVVATAQPGYAISGTSTFEVTVGAATGCAEIVVVTPADPVVTPSATCGVEGTYVVPATRGVRYLLNGTEVAAGPHSGPASGTITAEALEGYTLTNPQWSFALTLAPAAACPGMVVVAPVAPTVDPSTTCGVQGAFTIPTTRGVTYLLDGTKIDAGTYSGPMHATVTALAQEGYTLTTSTWSATINLDAAATCPSGTIPSTGGTTPTTNGSLPKTGGTTTALAGAAALALLLGTVLSVLGSRRPETTP